MSDSKTALVLGGGGSLGAVEVGFIKRFRELGCEFDLLVGTSVGALNASHVAFHEQHSHDCLGEIWQGLAGRRLYSRNPLQVVAGLRRTRLGLYDAGFLRRLIQTHIGDDRIERARIPLRITATDICSGQRRVFASGSLTQAVMASTAVPGLFPPVTIDGRMYVDGGVTSGGDIAAAVAEGATTVVFIDLRPMFTDQCPRNVLEVIARSFALLAEDRAACAAEHRAYAADIVHIQPGLAGPRGDFSDAPRLLEESYRMACIILDRCRVGGQFKAGHYHGALA